MMPGAEFTTGEFEALVEACRGMISHPIVGSPSEIYPDLIAKLIAFGGLAIEKVAAQARQLAPGGVVLAEIGNHVFFVVKLQPVMFFAVCCTKCNRLLNFNTGDVASVIRSHLEPATVDKDWSPVPWPWPPTLDMTARPEPELHQSQSHPGWEYETTLGSSDKTVIAAHPAGNGWIPNIQAAPNGWNRDPDNRIRSFWMRRRPR